MAAEVLDNTPSSGAPTPLQLRDRPWHVLSGRLNAHLDALVDVDVWSMDEVETAETIVELHRARARLAAAEARLLTHAQRVDVGEREHATSIAAWLRSQLR